MGKRRVLPGRRFDYTQVEAKGPGILKSELTQTDGGLGDTQDRIDVRGFESDTWSEDTDKESYYIKVPGAVAAYDNTEPLQDFANTSRSGGTVEGTVASGGRNSYEVTGRIRKLKLWPRGDGIWFVRHV